MYICWDHLTTISSCRPAFVTVLCSSSPLLGLVLSPDPVHKAESGDETGLETLVSLQPLCCWKPHLVIYLAQQLGIRSPPIVPVKLEYYGWLFYSKWPQQYTEQYGPIYVPFEYKYHSVYTEKKHLVTYIVDWSVFMLRWGIYPYYSVFTKILSVGVIAITLLFCPLPEPGNKELSSMQLQGWQNP